MRKTNKKQSLPLLLSFYLLLSLTACHNNPQEHPQAPEKPAIQVASKEQAASKVSKVETPETPIDLSSRTKISRTYALDVFKQFNIYNNETTPEKNLIISPLSFEYMMAMLMTGADQPSKEKITKALHFPENMQFHTQKADDDTRLLLANGIFIREPLTINPAFQQQMERLYQASIQNVGKNDANIINSWISKQTQGRIKKAVDNPVADATLVNAIYFKGKWPDEFFQKKHTKNLLFKGKNKQQQTPTMFQQELSHYYEDQNVQALYQPYKGGDYAILLLLPKGQTAKDLDRFINKLDEPYFTHIVNGTRSPQKNYEGELYLPRFETEYKNDQLLAHSQKLLGVDLTACLFPNITNHELKISKMLQIANIKLDEEGTEAAAVTVVEMAASAAPQMEEPKSIHFVMDINHPFAYAILDQKGNIVFIGTVKDIH